jgi:phage gpG-like protein
MSHVLGDLLAGASFFGAIAKDFAGGYREELERAAVILEAEAKSYPGNYQPGWAALKSETIARKATGDSPLLETGEMRDSITHNSDAHEAMVGSNDKTLIYQEFGTSRGIPPRPVLGLAMIKAEPAIVHAVGKVVMTRLVK